MISVSTRSDDGAFWNQTVFLNGCVIFICGLSFGFSWIESVLNLDSHHWGHMFVAALDVKNGFIPHREVYLQYGYITSLIQGIGLMVLGERIASVGIVTGFFYAISLFLCYRLFLKILPKLWAFLAFLLVFLLHGYITYPWSNYYTFTFQLGAILLYLKGNHPTRNGLLSGLLVGLALLTRYASVPAVIPPFFLYIFYELYTRKETKSPVIKKALMFCLGVLLVLTVFTIYLLSYGAFNDFLLQNKVAILAHAEVFGHGGLFSLPLMLAKNIVKARTVLLHGDLRAYLYTITFFVNGIILVMLCVKCFYKKSLRPPENIVLALSLFCLFGYLNALHIYGIFRLSNGASIGIGVVVFGLFQIYRYSDKTLAKSLVLIPVLVIVGVLTHGVILEKTSSVLRPWQPKLLTQTGVRTNEMELFKGKIMPPAYHAFYQQIYSTINGLEDVDSYYVINYTWDCAAFILNRLPRIQLLPFYMEPLLEAFPNETQRIQKVIDERKAVILSNEDLKLSGYEVIFNQPDPQDIDKRLFISAPVMISGLHGEGVGG